MVLRIKHGNVSEVDGTLALSVRGWKLDFGASLLALPMNPEEATKTQDNVGKASAILWIHSAYW